HADVPERRDHEVPRGVWIAVEQRERRLASMEDELLVGRAEDAAAALVGLLDVLEPPGRPERLRHGAEPSRASASGRARAETGIRRPRTSPSGPIPCACRPWKPYRQRGAEA